EKLAQSRVADIAQNFEQHAGDEIKAAYEGAKEHQVKLTQLEERQNQLEHKRKELETSLLSLRETAEKAENMVSQVAVVMDFIRGNLRDINVRLENLNQRQQMGLQIIRAQEEERKRVAREIHDGPAQSLANVVLRMEFCEKLMDVNPEKVRDELKDLKRIVRNNLQDVRKIIFDLRPMALDDLGVVPALKRYIEDFREKNDIYIEMIFHGRETRLEPVLEIALFRLIQEALNNVVKHARASNVKVAVEIKTEWVTAVVEDDGTGFVLERVLNSSLGTKFGLISMKERTDLLGGELYIDTHPGKGTKITFRIPVAYQTETLSQL
ncbi:MAG: sensor histidine kinase, partial [Eubacteriales bacterium]